MTDALMQVRDLRVTFRTGRLPHRRRVRAVDGVSLDVTEGETLGLVGESGSGKSTLGRAVLRLVDADSGTVAFRGQDLAALSRRELRRARRDIQMIFQDPYSSLDPSMIVAESIEEPLRVHRVLDGPARRRRVFELLELVGCSPYHAGRYPYEFSGGQRQRIAIARAIAINPAFVVCDEAVSALDVSTRNQVINLLERLRAQLGLAYLFIAHDLSVVRHISHRVAVMYLGQIVEIGAANRIYDRPAHPYTQALLSAIPVPDPSSRRERIVLEGDVPDPGSPPTGCPFHTRCAFAMDVCREVMPEMTPVAGGGEVACHLQTSGPTLRGTSLTDAGLHPTAAQASSAAGTGGPLRVGGVSTGRKP